MHLRTTERFVVDVLVDGHLHQRRATEIDRGGFLDQHGVLTHSRHVRTAGGGTTEDEGNRGDSGGREAGEFAEGPPAGHEDVGLAGEVRTTGFDKRDHGQSVALGDVEGTQLLGHRIGVERAALDRRLVGDDHALHAADGTDPGDQPAAGLLVRIVRPRITRQLEERRVLVQEQIDTLSRQQLPARSMALDSFRATRVEHAVREGLERFEGVEHCPAIEQELLGPRIDPCGNDRHRYTSIRLVEIVWWCGRCDPHRGRSDADCSRRTALRLLPDVGNASAKEEHRTVGAPRRRGPLQFACPPIPSMKQ